MKKYDIKNMIDTKNIFYIEIYVMRVYNKFINYRNEVIEMKIDEKKLVALKQLKKLMQKTKNKNIYAIVTHVSSTGMSRVIHFVTFTKDGSYRCLDWLFNEITGYNFDKSYRGLRVYGCGMDMVFNTLYVINSYAIQYKVIKTSKNRDNHDLRYNGLVNTSYYDL